MQFLQYKIIVNFINVRSGNFASLVGSRRLPRFITARHLTVVVSSTLTSLHVICRATKRTCWLARSRVLCGAAIISRECTPRHNASSRLLTSIASRVRRCVEASCWSTSPVCFHISVVIVLHSLERGSIHVIEPCAGSAVVRIDPLCFLAGCLTRWLNQALSIFLALVFCVFFCAAHWGHFLCISSLCLYVFHLLVVLIKLSVLVKWLARETALRTPWHSKNVISTKRNLIALVLLYCFIVFFETPLNRPTTGGIGNCSWPKVLPCCREYSHFTFHLNWRTRTLVDCQSINQSINQSIDQSTEFL